LRGGRNDESLIPLGPVALPFIGKRLAKSSTGPRWLT